MLKTASNNGKIKVSSKAPAKASDASKMRSRKFVLLKMPRGNLVIDLLTKSHPNRAINGRKPARHTASLDSKARSALSKAIALARNGKAAKAIKVLQPLASAHSKSVPLLGYLGGLYYMRKDYAKAVPLFRRTVKLSPDSELASLGLFHSLDQQKKRARAMAEAKRFTDRQPGRNTYVGILAAHAEAQSKRGPKKIPA
jgi:predicted Zn-dependent protease